MGAHTLGRVHNTISLHRYTWKTRSGGLFNNGESHPPAKCDQCREVGDEISLTTRVGVAAMCTGYYRNMASKKDWYYPTGKLPNGTEVRSTCIGYGDANYNRPIAKFVPKAFVSTTAGGPTHCDRTR